MFRRLLDRWTTPTEPAEPDTNDMVFEEVRGQRILLALVLDTTRTMAGAPLAELRALLDRFRRDLADDMELRALVRVAVVTFGGGRAQAWRGAVPVTVPPSPFVDADELVLPELTAAGTGSLLAAVELALDCIGQEKAALRRRSLQYYRPVMWCVSDGEPTDERDARRDEVRRVAGRIAAAERARRLVFFTASAGDDADPDAVLETLAPDAHLRARNLELHATLQLVPSSAEMGAHDPVAQLKSRVHGRFGASGD